MAEVSILKIKLFLLCALFMLLTGSASASERYIVKFNNEIQLLGEEKSFANSFTDASEEELSEYIEAGVVEYYEPIVPVMLLSEGNWQLENIKADFPDKVGALGNEVKVGIIDTGMNVYNNIRDRVAEGKNFTSEEGDETVDTNGHGTFVGSLVALHGSGAAYQSRIVPLKCFYRVTDSSGNVSYTSDTYIITKAIIAAVEEFDCDVINMSLTCGTNKWNLLSLKSAIDYAVKNGVIVVAAAGNFGEKDEATATAIHYPAGYSNVVGVASVDSGNRHSSFSQRNNSVYVSAPGESVVVSPNESTDNRGSGTSFASPIVSSAAAIAKGIKPDISAEAFMTLLRETSTDLGVEGYDVLYGYGLLNCEALVRKLFEGYSLYISQAKVENGKSSTTIFNNTKGEHTFLSAYSSGGEFYAEKAVIGPDEAKEIFNPFEPEKAKFMLWDWAKIRPLIPPLRR